MKSYAYRRKIAAVSLAAVVAVGGCGIIGHGAYSYLTDHTAVTNVTQQGKVGLTLTESDWTGDKTHVLPDAVFDKNPAVTATVDCVTPGYVYMQILVPCMKCTLCNEDKTLYDKDADGNRLKKDHMLLTFGCGEPAKGEDDSFICGPAGKISFDKDSASRDAGNGMTANISGTADGWTLLQVEDISQETLPEDYRTDADIHYLCFTYAYNSMICSESSKKKNYSDNSSVVTGTSALFEKVRVADAVEGGLKGLVFKMPVRAFMIQAGHSSEDSQKAATNEIPSSTADVIRGAASAYSVYYNQNADLDAAEAVGTLQAD